LAANILLDDTTETVEEDYKEEAFEASDQDGEDDKDYQPNVSSTLPEEANEPDQQGLIATTQSDFTITARPTRSGRSRKTCDMAKVHASICGIPVSLEDIEGGKARMCAQQGCETQWVSNVCMSGVLLIPCHSSTSNASILSMHHRTGSVMYTHT